MKRISLILAALTSTILLSYFGLLLSLRASLPEFALENVEPDQNSIDAKRSLPFFGLMTPVPKVAAHTYVPKLEYRIGPPERFLSKLSFLLVGEDGAPGKERLEYYGRRTLSSRWISYAERFTRTENWSYASFLEASLHYAKTGEWLEGFSSPFRPIANILFLYQARLLLGKDSTDVYVMDQAGIPAFLFQPRHRASLGEEAKIWFFRRNTLYEVRLASEGKFSSLDPKEIFRRSFLVEKRQDALAFVATELSEVKLTEQKLEKLSFSELEWPLLLLGAKLSIDPSSIHAFFHFAGLNALIFREHGGHLTDLEVLDSVRNNVLVSERYGRDVAPESRQSSEMSRLARALLQNAQ